MTNIEIIAAAAATAKIPADMPINTYAGWKRSGFQVKRGEKAVFQTKIWKPCKAKKKEQTETEDTGTRDNKKLILVNASFFTAEQVSEINEN